VQQLFDFLVRFYISLWTLCVWKYGPHSFEQWQQAKKQVVIILSVLFACNLALMLCLSSPSIRDRVLTELKGPEKQLFETLAPIWLTMTRIGIVIQIVILLPILAFVALMPEDKMAEQFRRRQKLLGEDLPVIAKAMTISSLPEIKRFRRSLTWLDRFVTWNERSGPFWIGLATGVAIFMSFMGLFSLATNVIPPKMSSLTEAPKALLAWFIGPAFISGFVVNLVLARNPKQIAVASSPIYVFLLAGVVSSAWSVTPRTAKEAIAVGAIGCLIGVTLVASFGVLIVGGIWGSKLRGRISNVLNAKQ